MSTENRVFTKEVGDRHSAIYERLGFVPAREPVPLPLEFYAELDAGIADAVAILNWHGIETCQSCEGAHYDAVAKVWSGQGHCYPEPTIDFIDSLGAGQRALGIALMYGLPVVELRSKWSISDGLITERVGQLVFHQSIREVPR